MIEFTSEAGASTLLGFAGDKGVSRLRTMASISKSIDIAGSFYSKYGFSSTRAANHMKGIDFSNPVETITLKKGTVVQQWVGENGIGNYFTTLDNGASKNLGISYEGRELKQFTLTNDVEVLRSTAADFDGNAGGGTQFFSTELKNNIKLQ